ncbi:AlpA family phage regulatory protein [Proteus vulgaris]|uniref:helix-turn-helix transcriptional regulator n=1 Tax=Proteus vulgaris TaxID=585 RepID=UPI0025765E31|nr:AlpA family phage regulatory protein [Proteus vulgaris]MDM3562515.1 AlpA family phage regulatory protein [Proteus vulgaris]
MINTSNIRILRLPAVLQRIGIARSTLYDWINPESPRYDPNFPKQRKLGRQSVGWIESELNEWLLERVNSQAERI